MSDKLFASLQARAALLGWSLAKTQDDTERPIYVATADAVTVTLRSAASVGAGLTGRRAGQPGVAVGGDA